MAQNPGMTDASQQGSGMTPAETQAVGAVAGAPPPDGPIPASTVQVPGAAPPVQ